MANPGELRVFITGGAGFIGSNFVRYVLRQNRQPSVNRREIKIVNLDMLTYAGNMDSIADLLPVVYKGKFFSDCNHFFVRGDIVDRRLVSEIFRKFRPHIVFNLAAESHVDRSINSVSSFIRSNIRGTVVLLEELINYPKTRFVQISTDEVLGSLGESGQFYEDTPINPLNPYSSSKAAAEHFCRAFANTHKVDIVITRCANNYGPYQHPEKLIPKTIINALTDTPIPVYGDGKQVRDWIFVEDHCAAIWKVGMDGKLGEVYHVGAGIEVENIEIVRMVLKHLKKPESLIDYVDDRPGHDWRYSVNYDKIVSQLNWFPEHQFAPSLAKTIDWYSVNREWWTSVLRRGSS